jgi:hypothetical protein
VQTEQRQQFRLTHQILAVVAVVFLALAVPVAMVIFSLQTMTAKKIVDPEPAASAPLEKALEDISAKNLAPAALSEGQFRVEIPTGRPERDLTRIQNLLKSFNAAALPPAREGETIRLLVTVAESRVSDFVAACQGEAQPAESLPFAPPRDQARVLVELVIQKRSAP